MSETATLHDVPIGEMDYVEPRLARVIAGWLRQRESLGEAAECLVGFADQLEKAREVAQRAKLDRLRDAVKMGTVEDIPAQVLYEGPPVKLRISEEWLRAMSEICEDRIATVWFKGLAVRTTKGAPHGDLCFTFTTEPEGE